MKTMSVKRVIMSGMMMLSIAWMGGCSSVMSTAASQMADNLSRVIMNHDDLETVRQGAPAYLLMIDSFLESDPHNPNLLISASRLYTAYSDVFVKDGERKKRLTEKGLEYGARAVCIQTPNACDLRNPPFDAFQATVMPMTRADIPGFYTLGAAWAAWIQARQDNWNGIAEISRVEAIMQRIIELDETYQDGGAHLYLGVIRTLLPPALGGTPEIGRMHFEAVAEIFPGNLMAKTLFAKQYARLMFDRELHDRLLTEVIAADPNVSGYRLSNLVAQEMAQELLTDAEDYF